MMRAGWVLTVLASAVIVSVFGTLAEAGTRDSKVVRTAQGPVRGYKAPDTGVYEFIGIPYATAPTGLHRFKAPLPGPIWMDTLDATGSNIICPQGPFDFVKPGHMQENCLVANVYVPDTVDKDLPVLVQVHGGGFQGGYSQHISPKNLVKDKNIITVSFNYRLGIHGFLCLGTKDIPGNAGMKDQVALLRWVNKNIAAFGGDPNDVTIAGNSAGSASVDLLMLSPSTKGLFKRVIPESGANMAAFAVQTNPLQRAKKHAKAFNSIVNVEDINELEHFYKTASFETLTSNLFFDEKDGTTVFSPCVERDLGEETFLTESPYDILKKGNYEKLPMLYGFSSMEGLFRLYNLEGWHEELNNKFTSFLPADLKFKNVDEMEKVAKAIKEFYFGDKVVNKETALEFVNFVSDVYFTYPVLRSARLQVQAGNNQIYLYEYIFVDEEVVTGFPEVQAMYPNVPRGAFHCDQTAAVLDNVITSRKDIDENTVSNKFKQMKKVMRDLWGNFIKYSEPVPKNSSYPSWPPADENRSPYMELGEDLVLRGPMMERTARFWDDIYEKYYDNPAPPALTSSAGHIEL